MNPRRYKSPIPKTAREIVDNSYPDRAKDASSYCVGRKMVGQRIWREDGRTLSSLDQQRDARQKGLGRAVQWATAGLLSTGPLLNACLHDQRFDRQCEENRGEWLWKLISLTGSASEFRDPLLNAFRNANDEQNAHQLCDLALHFARSGDDGFRQATLRIRRAAADCRFARNRRGTITPPRR